MTSDNYAVCYNLTACYKYIYVYDNLKRHLSDTQSCYVFCEWITYVFSQNFVFVILTSFCLLIVGVEGYCVTWSHTMIHTHPVWLPWTSDRPVAGTSTWQNTTLTRDIHVTSEIRTRNPIKQTADLRLKPRGQKYHGFYIRLHTDTLWIRQFST
jgi:hypothetical protein